MRLLAIVILLVSGWQLNAQTTEFGLASVYSDEYKESMMASGELYNPEEHTAAHKSLPFGSIVKVTNMSNKKAVMVKITDRGPFVKGYVVEVSRAVSDILGLKGNKGKVKLQVQKRGDEVDLLTDNTYQASEEAKATNPFSEVENKAKTPAKAKEEVAGNTSKKEQTAKATTNEVVAAVTPKQLPSEFSTKGVAKNEVELKKSVKKVIKKQSEPRLRPLKTKGYKQFDLYKVSTFEPKKGGYGVQTGVYTDLGNVLKETAKLQENWFSNIMLTKEKNGDAYKYKIIIGPFDERASAANYQKDAAKKGAKGFVVAVQPKDGLEISQIKALRLEDKGFAVQIMNLKDAESVLAEIEKLRKKWYKNILLDVVKGENGKPEYKVYLGPFPTRDLANAYVASLKKKKMAGFVVDLSK